MASGDDVVAAAIRVGQEQAAEVLARRAIALARRRAALVDLEPPTQSRWEFVSGDPRLVNLLGPPQTAGVLVAEGDSWFDYPLVDILKLLEDNHGYDIESVAHKGDAVEEMAYGGGQLEDFTRRLEKVLRRGAVPKAILFSGGGNDVAGTEFAMLLNHAASPIRGLNPEVISGVIDSRIKIAYITILSSVATVCREWLGRVLPVIIHGYDYPVPDGRGFLGGWWLLPGPWLEPGFRSKGYLEIAERLELAHELIDRFNAMLSQLTSLPALDHVQYVDLRGSLPTGDDYRQWWANEMHPTRSGFEKVTATFAEALAALP